MIEAERFAINHMTAPRMSAAELFACAVALRCRAVEIRNDLPGTAIADGSDPAVIRRAAAAHGVRILSINALQRFNEWSDGRADEARRLARTARDCGAEALVLCPVNDVSFRPADNQRIAGLHRALTELAPILAGEGLKGLVEPLGFPESSLRLKREAIEAIDATGTAATFKLVHDTFHHAVAGEAELFPERTGLVHISGVEDQSRQIGLMRDPDRVLVGPRDRLDNAGQMRRLDTGGYAGFFSFEPFAESVHRLADPADAIRASMEYLLKGRKSRAA
jgi:2-keto-myo-inositol isomerase